MGDNALSVRCVSVAIEDSGVRASSTRTRSDRSYQTFAGYSDGRRALPRQTSIGHFRPGSRGAR